MRAPLRRDARCTVRRAARSATSSRSLARSGVQDLHQDLFDHEMVRRDFTRHHGLAKSERGVDDDPGTVAGDGIERHRDAGR